MKEIFLIFLFISINPIKYVSSFNIFSIIRKIKGNSKKNIVLGVIERLQWDRIKPFFISYIKADLKNCECVIFHRYVNEETLTKLNSLGIITYEIPEKYKGMKINNLRYSLYEEYLVDKLDKYNMALHIDVRDSIFQKDVFEFYKSQESFLGIALEEGNMTDKYASSWMKYQYGEEIYEELKNKTIICSGTIWGTVDKFYELSKYIWAEIKSKSPYNINIHDQTAENYLIYHKKMFNDCIISSDIYSGPVMTVGLLSSKGKELLLDSENNILNFNGQVAAVIHQYDRFPKLVKMVKEYFDIPSKTGIKELIETKNKAKRNVRIKYIICFIIVIFIFILLIRRICSKIKTKKYNIKKIVKKKKIKKKRFKKAKIIL
jgi:hypothetical protein